MMPVLSIVDLKMSVMRWTSDNITRYLLPIYSDGNIH